MLNSSPDHLRFALPLIRKVDRTARGDRLPNCVRLGNDVLKMYAYATQAFRYLDLHLAACAMTILSMTATQHDNEFIRYRSHWTAILLVRILL